MLISEMNKLRMYLNNLLLTADILITISLHLFYFKVLFNVGKVVLTQYRSFSSAAAPIPCVTYSSCGPFPDFRRTPSALAPGESHTRFYKPPCKYKTIYVATQFLIFLKKKWVIY